MTSCTIIIKYLPVVRLTRLTGGYAGFTTITEREVGGVTAAAARLTRREVGQALVARFTRVIQAYFSHWNETIACDTSTILLVTQSLTDAYDHTTLKTPVLVRSRKSSDVGPG